MGDDYAPPLEPEDWFERGHEAGVHVWSPPPAAALDALKQLARSRLKRPHSVCHVVLIQRLSRPHDSPLAQHWIELDASTYQ